MWGKYRYRYSNQNQNEILKLNPEKNEKAKNTNKLSLNSIDDYTKYKWPKHSK